MIVGIDEVGRGCWAGPVVAGAVLLHQPIKGLKDSKKLTKRMRERLDAEIRIAATAFGIGWATPTEIDAWGLTEAVRMAMRRAFEMIKQPYERLIVDGNYNYFADLPNSQAVIAADNSVPAVSAASIIAKVARDHFMTEAARQYAGYGFERHVGYGTVQHAAALRSLGVCDLHRRSFKPVQAFLTP